LIISGCLKVSSKFGGIYSELRVAFDDAMQTFFPADSDGFGLLLLALFPPFLDLFPFGFGRNFDRSRGRFVATGGWWGLQVAHPQGLQPK